jgi:hypothetical protein
MQCMHDIPILCSSTEFLPTRPHAYGVLYRSRTVNIFELHEICMLAGKPVIASEFFVYTLAKNVGLVNNWSTRIDSQIHYNNELKGPSRICRHAHVPPAIYGQHC